MIALFSRTISGNVVVSNKQPEKDLSTQSGELIVSVSERFEAFHVNDTSKSSSPSTLHNSQSMSSGTQIQMMRSSSIQTLRSSTEDRNTMSPVDLNTEDRSTRSPVDLNTSHRISGFRTESVTIPMSKVSTKHSRLSPVSHGNECEPIEGLSTHQTRVVKGKGHQDKGWNRQPMVVVEEFSIGVPDDQTAVGVTDETGEFSGDKIPSWIRRTSSNPQSTFSISTESSAQIQGMSTRLLSFRNNSRYQSGSNSNDMSLEITLAGASQDSDHSLRQWKLFNRESGMSRRNFYRHQDEDRVKFRHFMINCIQRFDPNFSMDVVNRRHFPTQKGQNRSNACRDMENQKFQELTERFLTLECVTNQRAEPEQSGTSRTDNSPLRYSSFDQALNGEFFQAMEVRQNIRPHDCLDKDLKRKQVPGKSKSSFYPFFSRILLVFCFLGMCISFFWGVRSLRGWLLVTRSPVEAIRFNLESLPEDAVLNVSLLTPKFKFWHRNCEITNWVPVVTDTSITVNGTEPYHQITAFEVESEGTKLVVNTVEYFVGGAWTSKRSSRLTHRVDGSLLFLDDWVASSIEGEVYTLQPLWSWILVVSIGYLVNGVALLCVLLKNTLFSTLFHIHFHTFLRCVLVLHFFLHGADAIVHLTESLYKDSFLPILRAVLLAKISQELQSPETILLLGTVTSNGLIYVVALVIDRCWLQEDPVSLTTSWEFISALTIITSILIGFHIWNRCTRRRFARLKTRFQATAVSCVWMELLSQDNNHARLETFCDHLRHTFPDSLARSGVCHSFRPVKRAEVDDRDTRTLPLFRRIVRQISVWRRVHEPIDVFPTQSLDQLYQQAAAVQPMFLTYLRQWAAQTGPWLPGNVDEQACAQVFTAGSNNEAHERNFVLYGGESQDHLVSWPRLKSFHSSLEKIVNRCEGDASRCCDVVRGVLLFDTFDGIAEALKVIAAEPSVSVKRVKSNMSSEPSSNPFRFVKISFCLITEDAVKLGVEGFVCEVLLTFKAIWKAKDQTEYQDFKALSKGFHLLSGSLLFPSSSTQKDQESTPASMKSQDAPFVGSATHHATALAPDVTASQISRFRESACTPAGMEDESILGDVEEAVRDASPASVWLMANPIEAAMAKHEYFVLITGVFLSTIAVTFFQLRLWSTQQHTGSNFRFTSHLTRGAISPNIKSFGVALGGCPIRGDVNVTTFDENQTMSLAFQEGEIEYDAWYWVTSSGSPDSDPIVFSLEVQGVNGMWKTVGSSGFKEVSASGYHHELVEYPTPEDRLRLIDFPVGTSFTYKANYLSTCALVAGWTLFFLVKIVKKEQHTITRYFILLVMSYAVCVFAGSLVLMETRQGVWIPQMVMGILVGIYVLLIASVAWAFRYFAEVVVIIIGTAFMLYIMLDLQLYSKRISLRMIPLPFYSLLLFGIAVKGLQIYQWRTIKNLMLRDKRKNLAIWDTIVQKEEEIEGLRQVARLLQPYNMPTSTGVLQRGIEFYGSFETEGRLQPLWWRDLSFQVPAGSSSIGVPQTSLSLLLHQARSLQPFLFDKVRELSLASNGLFPITGDDGESQFIAASEVLADPQLLEKVKWPPLKRIDRIRQKLHRCYKSDVSKLCDLCRATIVHRTAADLLACMKWLMNDEEIHVLRTKNSMDPDSDPQHLSAFRQISVNLMISSEGTKRMGVSMHVAEIQLLLLPFAKIKTLDGHKRYIILRDARGE